MSSDHQETHAELESAIAVALADFAGVEAASISVSVQGSGLEGLSGPFHVELRTATEAASVAAAPESERPVGARQRDDHPKEITADDLDAEADAAADFLEGFLDAMDVAGDLKIRVHADRAEVEIADVGTGALIGRRGQTLDALQELVRSSLQRQFQRRSHVQIDAEGYRARRLEKLLEKVDDAIREVLDAGEPVRLEPMDVFERKAVHQRVADAEGVVSRSHGREPGRRVVIEAGEA
ncbi:MAG: R3H domain-containing nucleic acid-binding protein [Nitriliruptoraceae bacterium]